MCVSTDAPSAVTQHVRQSKPDTLGDSRGSSWIQQAALATATAEEAAGVVVMEDAAKLVTLPNRADSEPAVSVGMFPRLADKLLVVGLGVQQATPAAAATAPMD